MRICLFISLLFTNYLFSFPALSSFSEASPIKRNGKLFYIHQYQLDVGFGRVNDYLCLFKSTEYKNFSNLGDGIGYEAILDNNACQNGEVNLPWLVVSKQPTSSDNLVMEMSMPNNVADPRIKLILEEETSAANPYGVLTLDYNYVSMLAPTLNTPIYNATYESSVLDNNQVQFKATVYIDGIILNNLIPLGQEVYFYGTKILHNKNSGGTGTVTELIFNTNQMSPFLAAGLVQYFPSGYTKNYPDGNPYSISTTNFAYNEKVVKYEITYGYTGQKNSFYNADTSSIESSSSGTELCVSRTGSWEYVPSKRYGVYDSNGNRITFSTSDPSQALTADYDFTTSNVTYSDGKVRIFNGSWVGTGLQCKKLLDGSFYGDNICPGTNLGDVFTIVRINGHDYQNFPLFDVPEGTVLNIDQTGEEYYVRQLGVSKVYPARPQGDADCNSLTIQASMDTPDHTFFNYPVVVTPRTGAVLVNKLSTTTDLFSQSQGAYYSKDGDEDSDGIPNYLDAFPLDPLKNLDVDHDLIEDTEDNDTTVFQPDWTNYKHLEKAIYSNYLK
tara:strand:- start:179 stop:1846 length:1668 start_codon:yes stop_codon:yes gene_type:complete